MGLVSGDVVVGLGKSRRGGGRGRAGSVDDGDKGGAYDGVGRWSGRLSRRTFCVREGRSGRGFETSVWECPSAVWR